MLTSQSSLHVLVDITHTWLLFIRIDYTRKYIHFFFFNLYYSLIFRRQTFLSERIRHALLVSVHLITAVHVLVPNALIMLNVKLQNKTMPHFQSPYCPHFTLTKIHTFTLCSISNFTFSILKFYPLSSLHLS